MVNFNNGNNNSPYVSLTAPTTNGENMPPTKPRTSSETYDKFNQRTRCKGDVLFLKCAVVVLFMVVVWLVYGSYAHQKAIQSLHLSMRVPSPKKAAIIGKKDKNEPKYTCKLTVGRGISTSKVDMNYLLGTDCIKACKHMKKEDAEINGVIIFSDKTRNGCWCARNMTQIVDRYKTCFLRPNNSKIDSSSQQVKPTSFTAIKNVTCQFGDGVGGSEFRMGNLKGPECIATCQHLKAIDQSINGVTMYANTSKEGCWCEQRMTRVRSSRLFQTCKLSTTTSGQPSTGSKNSHVCDFTYGNGAGESEIKVGYQKGNDCINACIHMKDLDSSINGVTMYSNKRHVGCWCEKGMKAVDGTFKTCFLEPM